MSDDMLWGCLIAFGAFGLIDQGGDVFWLFVVIGFIGFGASLMKGANGRECNRQSMRKEPEREERRAITIPDDAHDAVEAFAKLVNRVYAILDQAYTRDKYFYQACITLRFGDDDTSSHAEFTFDFDWNMEEFFENYGYSLGAGFSVDGDSVCYKSDQVRNLYSWIGAASIKKRNGEEFDMHLAMVSIEGIVSTFVNSCPSAYAKHMSPHESGFFVLFKFK